METPPPAPEPTPSATPSTDPPPAPAPAATLSSEEKLWIIASHVSLLLGIGLVVPLVVYLVKKDESKRIADHAKEALNFHISVYIYCLACIPLFLILIGAILLPAIGIAAFVLAIIASIKAGDGILYRYPLTIRFVT